MLISMEAVTAVHIRYLVPRIRGRLHTPSRIYIRMSTENTAGIGQELGLCASQVSWSNLKGSLPRGRPGIVREKALALGLWVV